MQSEKTLKDKTFREGSTSLGKIIRKIPVILLGALILAAGMSNIHAFAGVTEGGVLGLSLLLWKWTGLSPAISSVILDGICFLIGWRFLGNGFLSCTVLSSVSYAIFYALFEPYAPLVPSLVTHPLWCALLGAVFVGVGTGITVCSGGACGGDDAIALTLRKKTGIKLWVAYLISDVSVLLLSLTYIPLKKIAFSFLTVLLSGRIIEWISQLWQRFGIEKSSEVPKNC